MAQAGLASTETPPPPSVAGHKSFLRKLFGRSHGTSAPPSELPREPQNEPYHDVEDDTQRPDMFRRASRKVVPGLPRAQTFKRQQSEKRNNLAPVLPTPAERRTVSVDRRVQQSRALSQPDGQTKSLPRASAPELFDDAVEGPPGLVPHAGPTFESALPSLAQMVDESSCMSIEAEVSKAGPTSLADGSDAHSMTNSQYDRMINDELERTWILNLSMHFRDKSKREKFFVTYREQGAAWRRVTISVDYRDAPVGSLEWDLASTKFQRDKSAKIYEAIRESLPDIQFYESVTNLKLQTIEGRLHVHVVEDVNEIIKYPSARLTQHLGCRWVRESEIDFDSHMSGFVYRVSVAGEVLIKKEIPGPDSVDEFLYEINALNRLRYSRDVIRFYGVVVDDHEESIKGLLIGYADHGALIDVIYDNRQDSPLGTPWPIRERWAQQIVQGLSDIHESGFVQGDFTLSNIVVDGEGNAKIIDINRRGCPVGWEPPEATPLIECGQRISMYIGVKSDLYQLGMVLWALATQEDEPEIHPRPLMLGPEVAIPDWYREVVEVCLSDDPRLRLSATSLLALFPKRTLRDEKGREIPPSISVDDGYSLQEYVVDGYSANGHARIRSAEPPGDWYHVSLAPSPGFSQDPYYYTRGRSPPSPLPDEQTQFDAPRPIQNTSGWANARDIAPSYSDVGTDDDDMKISKSSVSTASIDSLAAPDLEEAKVPAVFVEGPQLETDHLRVSVPASALTPRYLTAEYRLEPDDSELSVTPVPTPRQERQLSLSGAETQKTPQAAIPVSLPASPPYEDNSFPSQENPLPTLKPVHEDLPELRQYELRSGHKGMPETSDVDTSAQAPWGVSEEDMLKEEDVIVEGVSGKESNPSKVTRAGITVPAVEANNSHKATSEHGAPESFSSSLQKEKSVSQLDFAEAEIHGKLAEPGSEGLAPASAQAAASALEPPELRGVGGAGFSEHDAASWMTPLTYDDDTAPATTTTTTTTTTEPLTTVTTEGQE